ncbi:MAG: preprotein translocase subunit SecE [bacterium]
MSIFNKITDFFKESYIELKKVVWPSRSEVIRHTLIVIGVSLVVAIILGVFDYVFTYLAEITLI